MPQELIGLGSWIGQNLWEPTVQLALRDLCRPGSVVFDVGANLGSMTTVMSRMVGPRGVVCAFEASPDIAEMCQHNVIHSGCGNVQLFLSAVYHTSGETVPIYSAGQINDSIYPSSEGAQPVHHVRSIALDDFVERTGLVPDTIKMDIECAEYDALRGMPRVLNEHRPHLILEENPDSSQCLDLLLAAGYVAIDLNSYREIRTIADYPPGTKIRNNLYVHADRLDETEYRPPFEMKDITTLGADRFASLDNGSLSMEVPVELDTGRYLIDVDFASSCETNELMMGVRADGVEIFRYHANAMHLAESYRDWVIEVSDRVGVALYLDFRNGTRDESFVFRSATIRRIEGFSDAARRLYR